jgi:hypothetical protein
MFDWRDNKKVENKTLGEYSSKKEWNILYVCNIYVTVMTVII